MVETLPTVTTPAVFAFKALIPVALAMSALVKSVSVISNATGSALSVLRFPTSSLDSVPLTVALSLAFAPV